MEQVQQAIERITNQIGKADILINCAGVSKFATLLDMDPEEWKKIIDVNLMGTYNVTRTVLPQLIEKNSWGCDQYFFNERLGWSCDIKCL